MKNGCIFDVSIKNKDMENENEKEYQTIEDVLNDELVTEWIEEQDKDLAESGWTYKDVKAFADTITNAYK